MRLPPARAFPNGPPDFPWARPAAREAPEVIRRKNRRFRWTTSVFLCRTLHRHTSCSHTPQSWPRGDAPPCSRCHVAAGAGPRRRMGRWDCSGREEVGMVVSRARAILVMVVIVGVCGHFGGGVAYANNVVFSLNCIISGGNSNVDSGGTCIPGGPFGTERISVTGSTSTSTTFSITETLSGGRSGVLKVFLNIPDALQSLTWTSNAGSVTVSDGGQKPDGYNVGMLDMEIPGTGNIDPTGNPVTFTLTATGLGGGGLDPSIFNDTADNCTTNPGDNCIYKAVHIAADTGPNGQSLWVGSLNAGQVEVPEAGTGVLVGAGLLAAAITFSRGRRLRALRN